MPVVPLKAKITKQRNHLFKRKSHIVYLPSQYVHGPSPGSIPERKYEEFPSKSRKFRKPLTKVEVGLLQEEGHLGNKYDFSRLGVTHFSPH